MLGAKATRTISLTRNKPLIRGKRQKNLFLKRLWQSQALYYPLLKNAKSLFVGQHQSIKIKKMTKFLRK